MLLGLPPLISIIVLGGMEGEVIGVVQFLPVFFRIDGVHGGDLGLFAEGLRTIMFHA